MEPHLETLPALLPILAELKRIEPIFHSAHPGASVEQFEKYVAPEFWEVGASGNRYSREFALKVLAGRQAAPEPAAWRTEDWHVAAAGGDAYLLTYTLFQPGRVTRRLSVWRRRQQGWQVVYHQGTVVPAAAAGDAAA